MAEGETRQIKVEVNGTEYDVNIEPWNDIFRGTAYLGQGAFVTETGRNHDELSANIKRMIENALRMQEE